MLINIIASHNLGLNNKRPSVSSKANTSNQLSSHTATDTVSFKGIEHEFTILSKQTTLKIRDALSLLEVKNSKLYDELNESIKALVVKYKIEAPIDGIKVDEIDGFRVKSLNAINGKAPISLRRSDEMSNKYILSVKNKNELIEYEIYDYKDTDSICSVNVNGENKTRHFVSTAGQKQLAKDIDKHLQFIIMANR